MRPSLFALRLVFLILLEAESCDKLLQSNPHATNGTYQIAINSTVFPVSVLQDFICDNLLQSNPRATNGTYQEGGLPDFFTFVLFSNKYFQCSQD